MSVIPCEQNTSLRDQIQKFAEVLKTQAHLLGEHGLNEHEFYNSGLFRGAIERIRGQYSASMGPKREFVQHILNQMEDVGLIEGWDQNEAAERFCASEFVRLRKHGKRGEDRPAEALCSTAYKRLHEARDELRRVRALRPEGAIDWVDATCRAPELMMTEIEEATEAKGET